MPISLMPIIQSYVDASNAHDVKSIVACFADDALVRDENATRRSKIDIERWVTETIDKYKFHFKPLSTRTSRQRNCRERGSLGKLSGQPGHA